MTKINYSEILERFPWIIERKQKIVLSPDSDGILCGLLYTNFLEAEIVGYYDGKVLILKEGENVKDCTFLDIEIFNNEIRSCGHHMVLYNKNILRTNPGLLNNFSNCIQPNLIRGFDALKDFQKKYPFATIHFLLSILQHAGVIEKKDLHDNSIRPLLFTDGTWNNLFGYTENCLDWFEYLNFTSSDHILHDIFCGKKSTFEVMNDINELLRTRDQFNAVGHFFEDSYIPGGRNKRTGDKFRISNNKGEVINLEKDGETYKIHSEERNRMISFYSYIASEMGWSFDTNKWNFEKFNIFKFTKSNTSADGYKNITNGNYSYIMENPLLLSLAITSGQGIEYTIDSIHYIKDPNIIT